MDQSWIYQIKVQGELDPAWSDRLGGMKITVDRSEEFPIVTILEGSLRDQAALAGILKTLYEVHLPVLSVQRLKKEKKV
jgi:hypothetical protein